jgi:hypothetical protein
MATRSRKNPPASGRVAPIIESIGTVLSTFSGPSTAEMAQGAVDQLDTPSQQRLATQKIGAQSQMPTLSFEAATALRISCLPALS